MFSKGKKSKYEKIPSPDSGDSADESQPKTDKNFSVDKAEITIFNKKSVRKKFVVDCKQALIEILNMSSVFGQFYKKCVVATNNRVEPEQFNIGGGPKEGGISCVLAYHNGFVIVDLLTPKKLDTSYKATFGDKIHIGTCGKIKTIASKSEDILIPDEIENIWNMLLPLWIESGVLSVKLELNNEEAHNRNKLITIYVNPVEKKVALAMISKIALELENHIRYRKSGGNPPTPIKGDLMIGSSNLLGYRNDRASIQQCINLIAKMTGSNQVKNNVARSMLRRFQAIENKTLKWPDGLKDSDDTAGELFYVKRLEYFKKRVKFRKAYTYLHADAVDLINQYSKGGIVTCDPCKNGLGNKLTKLYPPEIKKELENELNKNMIL